MKVNHQELNVKSIGTGAPFIWGHGLMFSMALEDSLNWIHWDKIAENAQLVRYDARGHGLSEVSDNPQDYHWANLAKDMLALADAEGFDKFVAGGQSMGCATTIYAALAAPERMKGLVLMNPPTAWETRAAQAGVYDKMAEVIETKGIDGLLGLMAQQPMGPSWQMEAFPDFGPTFLNHFKSYNPKALALTLRGAKLCNLPPREDLTKLTMPALILAWVDDPGHPISSAEECASRMPNSQLVIAKNGDDVATWTERIQAFLKSVA